MSFHCIFSQLLRHSLTAARTQCSCVNTGLIFRALNAAILESQRIHPIQYVSGGTFSVTRPFVAANPFPFV
jgi:hypothetical protein